MFGIGLPEMILILALALIVVGPDKLPDLARSVAKGVMELKKTAEALKKNLTEDGNPLDDLKAEIKSSTQALENNQRESSDPSWQTRTPPREGVNPAPASPDDTIIDAELTEIEATAATPDGDQQESTGNAITAKAEDSPKSAPTLPDDNKPPVC